MANDKDFQVKNNLNVQGGKLWLNDTPASSGNQSYATIDGSNGGDLILSSDNLISFFESDGPTRRVVFDCNDNKYSFGDSTSHGTTDTQTEMFQVSGSGRFTSSLNVDGSILGKVSSAGTSTQNSGNSHSLLNNVFLNPSPEGGGAIDIRTVNELAGFNTWGTISSVSGFFTTRSGSSGSYTYSNEVTSITDGNIFDGVASNAGSWYTNDGADGTGTGTGTFTLDFNSKKELDYTCYVGIVFGNTSFIPKRVKIEVYRNGAWQTECDLTNNTAINVMRRVANNNANGVQKIRYTVGGGGSDGSTGYFRIQDVYAIDHDAGANAGPKGIHYVRRYGNSNIYGSILPATDSTYTLGDSDQFFLGVYSDKLYLNNTAAGTTSTALILDGTEVKTRTLGSNAFNSTSFEPLQTHPASGAWFSNGSPVVGADGVMEVGRYIDFHTTNTTTEDHNIRLDCESANVLNVNGGTLEVGGHQVLTTNDEGSGNGIDADTVDGVEASSFLRSDANDSSNSVLTLSGANPQPLEIHRTTEANAGIKFTNAASGVVQQTAYLGLGNANGEINIGSSTNVQGNGNRITTVADKLNAFAATTSAELAGKISDETGSGALVFATSPTLVTPALGTPASGDLQNCSFPTLNQDTSGTADHVTVTDNESTNEENLITFVENAQSGTGSHGLEMDGNLTYNPSTGTITSTKVSTTNLTATDGSFTGTVSANSFSKLSGKPVEEITVGTKIQSQNTLAPRVVTNATDKIFYAAMENNTRLYKNNELLATLSKGTSSSIAAADISLGDIIHSDRPVSLRQNGRPLASLAATGSFFIARTRGGSSSYSHAHFGVYPPYADGSIKYIVSNTGTPAAGYVDFSDSNAYDASSNPNGWQSLALTQGTVGQLTITAPVDGSSVPVAGFYWLQSDTPVVITQTTSNSSTWTGHQYDAKLLKEVTREVLSYDEGTQTKFDPDNTGTITVSNSGSWRYSRSDSNLLFAHNDEGDGDGGDGTQGIPWKMCGDSYIIDHGLRGYQIATIEPSIISAYYWNGSAWVLYKTHDLSAASRDSFAVHVEGNDEKGVDNTNFIGQANSDRPWRFIGTGRFALRVNTPSSDLSEVGNDDDEYFVLGYDSDLRSQDVIRVGKIVAEDISAATITGDKIASNTTINVGPAGATKVGLDGTGGNSDEIRIFAGHATKASAPFQVKHDGALVATNATITGAITANSGTFTGAVNASSGTFTGNVSTGAAFTAGNSGIDGAGSGDDAVRIFAGNALADKATAEFRVTNAGAVNATNANITGNISASDLTMSDPSKVLNLTAGLIADGSVKDTSFDASGINKIEEVVSGITGLTNGDYQQRPSSAPAGSIYSGSLIANDTAEGFISNLQITDFAHGSKNPLINLAVLINLESSDNAATVLTSGSNTRIVGRFGIFASINGGADTQIGSYHDLTLTTANAVLLANGNTRYTFVDLGFVGVTHSVPSANNGDNITYKIKIFSNYHQSWQANKVSGTYEVAFIVSEAPTGEVATLETDGSLIVTKPSHGDATLLTLKQSDSSADMGTPSSFIDFTFTDSDSNETPQARIAAKPRHSNTSEQQKEGQGRLSFAVNNADTTGGAAGTSMTEMLVIEGGNFSDSANVNIGEYDDGSYKLNVSGNLGYNRSPGYEINEIEPLLNLELKNGRSVDLTTATGASLLFTMPIDGTSTHRSAAIAAMRESNTDSNSSTGLAFFVSQDDQTLDEAMRIDHDMNVGIGTSSIDSGNKLEVVGKIDASGDNGTFCTDHWTLPHADGSNGQVLTTDGSGAISWATPTDNNTFRTIKVDTTNNGTADTTLDAAEELQLIGGTAVTLSESGGVVTINSSDTDTNTTYGISAVDSGADVLIRLADSGGTNDDVKLVSGDNITITPSSDDITIAVADDITSGSFITDKVVSNDYNNDGSSSILDLSYLGGIRGATDMHVPQYGIGTTGLQVKAASPVTYTGSSYSGSDGYISLHCGKPAGQTNTTYHTAALTLDGSLGEAKIFTSTSNGEVEFVHTGTSSDGVGGYTYAVFNTGGATFTKQSNLSSAGPVLTLKRKDNDADGDKLGQLLFQGHNDASTPQTTDYASITTHVVDESEGSEDGKIVFDTITTGSQVTGLEIEGKTLKVGNTIKFDTSVLTSRSSDSNLNVQFVLMNYQATESVLVLDDRTRLAAYAFNLTASDGVNQAETGDAVLTYSSGDHSVFADHIYANSSSTYFIDLFNGGLSVHTAGHIRVRDDKRMGFGTSDDVKMFYDNNAISSSIGELEIEMESTCQQIRMTDNATTRFTFARSSGDFTATGNVTAYSDERLKSDIKTLDPSKTLQMRGVEFTKDGKKGSGVIAQELEKIAPELVLNEGEYKSVAYGNLSGYLIETIKDQQKQIDELKALVEKLVEKL